jgi:glycine C-acetyltransferase
MYKDLQAILKDELVNIRESGLYKEERVLQSPQGRLITVEGKEVLNFCSNNYLGLSGRPELAKASDEALEKWGFGVASVRFICGTQQIHHDLEAAVAKFLKMEDAVTYSSCFMANVGLFQTFFGPDDAILSDELNHASIIDAVRLTKSERLVYKHMDMEDLEEKLKTVKDKRLKVIATDGVFSMDGDIAPLSEICDLADKYGALVMVDDAHGVGVLGDTARGTQELTNTTDRIDFLTGTFGKALGGAGGAYTATKKEVAEYLRQRSRTYLFSNALDTGIAGAALYALKYVDEHPEVRQQLWDNTQFFRGEMKKAGFQISDAKHSITPIMLAEEKMAGEMAAALFDEGIYAVGFSFPVVPRGKARIRVQISAAHTKEDLETAVEKFTSVAKKLGVIS